MADKAIGELIAAERVNQSDLFVLEQDGAAKKLTGQILENWLLAMAQGHGGIQSIDKVGTSGLVETYRITLADTSYFDFPVTNGKSITGVKKSGTAGLVDTYTIGYNDGSASTFTVTNGAKGDKGDNAYTWIKYASQEPTESSHSMGDIPDNWIGIYSGNAASAPTDWKQYKWYKIKGDQGNTGDPARLLSSSVTYMVSDSGTIVPSGSWVTDVPAVPQGKYLWTRVIQTYNTGSPVTSYSVSRMGMDGSGSVSTVAGISPDPAGNVPLTAADVGALAVSGGDVEGPINMNGQPISGLNDPTEESQAARKGYVDKMLPKSGGTMSGSIAMRGNRITDLGTPTSNSDAATKGYSDIAAYPVGAIYISTVSTSPASLFGGTWERLKDRFLLGAGDSYTAGSTGGEATHMLTVNEMPSHVGHMYSNFDTNGSADRGGDENSYFLNFNAGSGYGKFKDRPYKVVSGNEVVMQGYSRGGNTAHNNMPPYLAVYMWKRVA